MDDFRPQPKPQKRSPNPRKPLQRSPLKRTHSKSRQGNSKGSWEGLYGRPRKADRPSEKSRKARKVADRKFQAEGPGEGTCENCCQWRLLTKHHIIHRSDAATRHEESNTVCVCLSCHNDIHALSAEKLLTKYQQSLLRTLWKSRIEAKRKIPSLRPL